jgi:rhodanese-related sulfurtransferase
LHSEQFRGRSTDNGSRSNDERSTGWNRIGRWTHGDECNSRFDEGATAAFSAWARGAEHLRRDPRQCRSQSRDEHCGTASGVDGGGAILLDARPYEEYAVSHIPTARAVPAKPGTTPALYVGDAAEIAKTIPDKTQPLILYCNGLFCGRSERFAEDLTKLGYRNVRRYQLGAPGWRALGGVMQVEKPALLRLLAQDATSVLIDGRTELGRPRLRNAVSIPLPEASKAKDDGRLPMTDHNTRIFVVGTNGSEARAVAEAIVRDAFHNVTFFGGAITDLPELLEDEEL